MREILAASPSGFLHTSSGLKTFDHTEEGRRAFYEKIWASPGFSKLTTNYIDMMTDPAANAEWCEFIAEKIRGIVKDPAVADKLIPKDHGYAGKRPPFVTNYFEAYNRPKISLVDLTETPILRVTETGIETTAGHREHDMIVWATGFDFGTGSLMKLGARGRGGLPLEEYWADGPVTFLGLMCQNFPNFFFPGGPHGAAGNNPRYGGDQSDFIADALVYMREHGYTTIEVPATSETSVDLHGRHRGAVSVVHGKQLFLRDERPWQGPPVSHQPNGTAEAARDDEKRRRQRISGLPEIGGTSE